MFNDETIFCGIGNGKRLAYNTMIDNYLINIMAKLKIQKKDWLHSNIKCGGMASVSWKWSHILLYQSGSFTESSCEPGLNADILDSYHIIILSWQNEITSSANRWPQQNAEKAVGCAKLADTTHYMVLQSWHMANEGFDGEH